jgi:acetolactate synthase-1/2/3 large subunit
LANGAERVIEVAVGAGIEVCFANPGTTELPVVDAMDSVGGIRGVLGLHENVCTGAADGYGRLAGKPALTLLHLGPGLANGIANLHNARRARAPVVNLIGEHASWHLSADPPLAMDIAAAAGTVSAFQRRVASADDAAPAMAETIAAAMSGPGAVATLVLPHDHQLAEAAARVVAVLPRALPAVDGRLVAEAASRLDGHAALLLGGAALHGEGLALAGRIAMATGATLIGERSFARMEAGRGLPLLRRLPYFPEQAQAMLDGFAGIVVCGTELPVAFFGYADKPARYLAGRDDVTHLAGQDGDALAALRGLAERVGAGRPWQDALPIEPLPLPVGNLDAERIGGVLAALLPEGAIVALTAVSSSAPYGALAHRAPPHTEIALTGGAIGEGPALALGAAIACPNQKVINLEADGSGAYICQGLWSQAREGLGVVTVICANRRYRILQMEQERAGTRPGANARRLTGLGPPWLDWVALAKGFGVPGRRVETAEALAEALAVGIAEPGPMLIEALF